MFANHLINRRIGQTSQLAIQLKNNNLGGIKIGIQFDFNALSNSNGADRRPASVTNAMRALTSAAALEVQLAAI
jgi:hypothetical protein